MDWAKLKFFMRTAKYDSFLAASENMHITQSSVSRTIANLEYELKVRLFYRTRKGITLTEEGKEWLSLAEAMMNKIQHTKEKQLKCNAEPCGSFKVAVASGLMCSIFYQYVAEFLKKYPKINLSLIGTDSIPNLHFGEADVVIRPPIFDERQESLVQIPLVKDSIGLYASPDYLKEHGIPEVPEDLDRHRLIGFEDYAGSEGFHILNYHLALGKSEGIVREPYVKINTPGGRLFMAEAGLGIIAKGKNNPGLLPTKLVPVLPTIEKPTLYAYYIYPKSSEHVRKIKLFGEHLKECCLRDFANTDILA
jgi:DNA-binding transcriptional LysR family regulator